MKILLDTCVWGGVKIELEQAGYDVIWTGLWDEDPGDDEILNYAYKEGRILVTIDKDFGELAIIYRKPHHGILRIPNVSSKQQASICLYVLKIYGNELQSGAIVTAERGRVRIRPSENQYDIFKF
jgi:predicted nuclease of predicted toxin-antitoxin system